MNILVTGANGQLGNEMRLISKEMTDHFIFTDEDYLSMRATGVLQKLRHDIATLKRQIIT